MSRAVFLQSASVLCTPAKNGRVPCSDPFPRGEKFPLRGHANFSHRANWSLSDEFLGPGSLARGFSEKGSLPWRVIRSCDIGEKRVSCSKQSGACSQNGRSKLRKKRDLPNVFLSSPGLVNALQCAQKDANLLMQEFSKLDNRARQDVAFLGSRFISIDEKARQDCLSLDQSARLKVEQLSKMAVSMEECAKSEIKNAALLHWNDGKLDEDLRLADLRAKRRILEDTYFLLQFVCSIQEAVLGVKKLCDKLPVSRRSSSSSLNNSQVGITEDQIHDSETKSNVQDQLEFSLVNNGMQERIKKFQASYPVLLQHLANEEEETDFSDSDELELIASALLDLEEVTSASGLTFVSECVNSPRVETRRAIAEALSAAPSLCSLGNAGIGALQKLAEDSNETVAEAASMALLDLKHKWEKGGAYSNLLFFPVLPQQDTKATSEEDQQ